MSSYYRPIETRQFAEWYLSNGQFAERVRRNKSLKTGVENLCADNLAEPELCE